MTPIQKPKPALEPHEYTTICHHLEMFAKWEGTKQGAKISFQLTLGKEPTVFWSVKMAPFKQASQRSQTFPEAFAAVNQTIAEWKR